MGHHEESYAEEDRKIAKLKEENHERIRKHIVNDLLERSLIDVLADIVDNPDAYKRSAGRKV